MKQGQNPPYLGARAGRAPEFPHYWDIPADSEAGVALLVKGGLAEYETEVARGAAGRFVPAPPVAPEPVLAPAPEPVPAPAPEAPPAPAPAPTRPFQRKNGR
jgi:hypothetical protein